MCTIVLINRRVSQMYQVRKHPKNVLGRAVLGLTRYENRGKVRLVDRFQT
jgi:hypothetical protein